MEANHSDGVSLSVSVWTSLVKSEDGNRCVVVMEPVQKIAAAATVSHNVSFISTLNSAVTV